MELLHESAPDIDKQIDMFLSESPVPDYPPTEWDQLPEQTMHKPDFRSWIGTTLLNTVATQLSPIEKDISDLAKVTAEVVADLVLPFDIPHSELTGGEAADRNRYPSAFEDAWFYVPR